MIDCVAHELHTCSCVKPGGRFPVVFCVVCLSECSHQIGSHSNYHSQCRPTCAYSSYSRSMPSPVGRHCVFTPFPLGHSMHTDVLHAFSTPTLCENHSMKSLSMAKPNVSTHSQRRHSLNIPLTMLTLTLNAAPFMLAPASSIDFHSA